MNARTCLVLAETQPRAWAQRPPRWADCAAYKVSVLCFCCVKIGLVIADLKQICSSATLWRRPRAQHMACGAQGFDHWGGFAIVVPSLWGTCSTLPLSRFGFEQILHCWHETSFQAWALGSAASLSLLRSVEWCSWAFRLSFYTSWQDLRAMSWLTFYTCDLDDPEVRVGSSKNRSMASEGSGLRCK